MSPHLDHDNPLHSHVPSSLQSLTTRADWWLMEAQTCLSQGNPVGAREALDLARERIERARTAPECPCNVP